MPPMNEPMTAPISKPQGPVRGTLIAVVLLVGAVACTSTPDSASSGSAGASQVARASASPAPEASAGADTRTRIGDFVDLAIAGSGRYQRMLRALLVGVDGEVLIERYRSGIDASDTANTYSVTKSVLSTLVGMAIDEGLIPGVDATLGELLPAEPMPEQVRGVTLRQVLTMSGGFAQDSSFYRTDDWVAAVLADPANRPGGNEFVYSDGSSHLLSAILAQATGRPALDYARERLFDPLGISSRPASVPTVVPGPAGDFAEFQEAYDAASGFAWSVDPTGLNAGFSDLKITPRDMLRIGQLYLDDGQHAGEQVVPAEWVAAATTRQVESSGGFGDGYGYQWWVGQVNGHRTFASIGIAGQLIQVVPDLQLVVVAAADPDVVPLDGVSISSDLVVPIATMLG